MAAKFKFPAVLKSLEDLDEKYRPLAEQLYEKDGEEFFFQGFDGDDAKKKLDEFRSNNRKYYNRIKELEAEHSKLEAFKDVDPEKYKEGLEALSKLNEIKNKELLDKGQFEEVFKKRTEEKDRAHGLALKAKEEAISSLTTERDNYKRELDGVVIDGLVTRVASRVGTPKKGAMPHILNHGRQIWKLNKEGKAQAFHPNGEVWYGKDGNPINEEEWGGKLLEEAGFMFEPGKGGNAAGGAEDDGVKQRGNVKYIDRTNPRLMAQYAKEILEGTVVAQ